MSNAVEQWKKRLNRKGPFYLLRTETHTRTCYDHSEKPPIIFKLPNTHYVVIWNDGAKTKIGSLHDHMVCRYGISTWSVLNGDTPFDLWNGAGLSPEDFNEMLKVRKGQSALLKFDLDTLKGLTH